MVVISFDVTNVSRSDLARPALKSQYVNARFSIFSGAILAVFSHDYDLCIAK
jgi:hypothetical protein